MMPGTDYKIVCQDAIQYGKFIVLCKSELLQSVVQEGLSKNAQCKVHVTNKRNK